MDDRIGGVDQAVIIVRGKAELRRCQVAAKDPHARLEIFVEARKLQMELQRLPQPGCGFLGITGAHQYVERSAVLLQQVGRDMRANVSGRTGQEYRQVAPFVPVLTTSPFSGTVAGCKLREGRASNARPSIKG